MDKNAEYVAQASNSEVENVIYGLIDKLDQLNVKLSGKLNPYTEELNEKSTLEPDQTSDSPYPTVYYTPIGQKLRQLDTMLDQAHRKVNRAQL